MKSLFSGGFGFALGKFILLVFALWNTIALLGMTPLVPIAYFNTIFSWIFVTVIFTGGTIVLSGDPNFGEDD